MTHGPENAMTDNLLRRHARDVVRLGEAIAMRVHKNGIVFRWRMRHSRGAHAEPICRISGPYYKVEQAYNQILFSIHRDFRKASTP